MDLVKQTSWPLFILISFDSNISVFFGEVMRDSWNRGGLCENLFKDTHTGVTGLTLNNINICIIQPVLLDLCGTK